MAKSGPRNSAKITINNNYFTGGVSISRKLGISNAFYSSQCLDYRTDPSQMSVLPGMSNIGTNLNDLITAMEQDLNGVRWGAGNNGGLYRINSSNVVSKVAELPSNGAAGLLYNPLSDQLYIPSQQEVSLYGQVTTGNAGNPIFRSGQFAESGSNASGCVNLFSTPNQVNGGSGAGFFDGYARNNSQSLATGLTRSIITSGGITTNATQTYTVPTKLTEQSSNFCFFAPDIEPFYSIWVYIANKGTGNWTLTLHDALNTQLAQVTITNANLKTGYNEFKFSGPVRAIINASQSGTSATYHWHVTSTVNDGTVNTITSGDLSTADFILFAYRLVAPKNGFHPTAFFNSGGIPLLCIGNANYLATYNFGNDNNPSNQQFSRHFLQFKHGFEVCGLTSWNQYLVIAVERKSSNSSRNAQGGGIYLWDGTTNAPSLYIDVPMGSPYGITAFNNVVYFACAGSLFAYSGGQTVIKVRKLFYENTDYLNSADNTIVYPNMMTSRYNVLMLGYPSGTNNPNINFGVWSWGAAELTYPNVFGYSYALSNGYQNTNTGGVTNLQIGCVVNFVDSMYVSWSYTLNGQTYYGLDLLDNFSTPAPNFNWSTLIWDGGSRYKVKQGLRMKVSFLPLPAGASITPFYSIDRGSNISADPDSGTSYTQSTANSTNVVIELNNARFHELQWGFSGKSGTATTPITITGVSMELNPLPDEIDIRADG